MSMSVFLKSVFRVGAVTVVCAVMLGSCNYIDSLRRRASGSKDAIVSIGDEHLYRSDIAGLVPAGTSAADSIVIVDDYIRAWATDVLLYRNARRNVVNEEEIKRLMEDYRRSITIHYYRQNMVQERVEMPSDADAAEYYREHDTEFLLAEPAVRGMLVALPLNTGRMDVLRRKMKNPEKNIADIERFALQNAVVYSIFVDEWMPMSAVENSTGRRLSIERDGYFEIEDSSAVSMIYITDFIPAGQPAPQQMVIEDARLKLFQQRKMQYLRNMDDEIYEYALRHGEIVFNLPKPEPDTVVGEADTSAVVRDEVMDLKSDTIE